MFEFLMPADLGINPIDIGAVTPTFSSASSTPLPSISEPLSEETIARFQAAMEKPLADNAILQQALESMVVTKERPVVITEKPAVQVPVLATENTEVTERAIVEKPIIVEKPVNVEKSDIQVFAEKPQVVVTEASKAFEPSVNFEAKELPVATPETFNAVVVENKEVAKVFEAIIAEKPVVISEKPIIAEKPTAAEKPVTIVDNKMVVQVPVLATENTKVTDTTVVANKPFVAGDEPVIVEKTDIQVSAEKPQVVDAEAPKVSEPSVNFVAKELPVATPETFMAVVVENKEVAKVFEAVVAEKPVSISSEKLTVSEKPVVVVADKPNVQVPVLHTENTEVTERAIVEKPIIVEKPDIVDKAVVADKPQQVVVTEAPKVSSEPSVSFVAKERPVVTPETFKPEVVEKPQIVEKPVIVGQTVVTETPVVTEKPVVVEKPRVVEVPVFHAENTKVTESAFVDKPVTIGKPVIVDKAVVADKPQQVVVTEAPKASEHSVSFVAKEEPIVKVATVKVEDETQPEEVTIAALPQGVAPEAIVRPIEVKPIEVAPVVSASVEAKVEVVTAAEVLVQAATAVADTMLVSPGLMRGEGEIIVHLKPEVLEATELKISVQSGTMTVEFAPTVEKIATLLTQNQANLVQVLSERVGRYNVVVNVRPSHLKGTRNARA